MLVEHGISSAPVWSQANGAYVGMLDYRDIVDFVLIVFRKKRLDTLLEDESMGIVEIMDKATEGEKVPAEAVSDLSRKNPFYSVPVQATLAAAVEILAESFGVHRVNVLGENERVQGVLSQSDVVRFLVQQKQLKPVMDKTLRELGLDCRPVVSIHMDMKVLDALQKMSEFSVSSIAVVDASNSLVGNISMADVRVRCPHTLTASMSFSRVALADCGCRAPASSLSS